MRQTTTLLHGFLALLISASALAGDLTLAAPTSAEALGFARYITSIHRPDQFAESGPVAVAVEASLPGLNKESRLLAKRLTGESERSEYHVVQSDGYAAVTRAVIAPYLAAQERRRLAPVVCPDHSGKPQVFRDLGEVATEGAPAHAFGTMAKKKTNRQVETNSG